jgi:CSLREA domain-containing protein
MRRRWLVLALAVAALAAPQAASAASIAVTTTADELNADGDCSLREAVQAANTNGPVDDCDAGSGADAIALPAGHYELTGAAGENSNAQGDLDVTESLTIEGAGSAGDCPAPNSTCIDADDLDRVLDVRDGAAPVAVTLRDLTLAGGSVPTGLGGAVSSQEGDGELLFDRAAILSGAAVEGAGIDSAGGLELRDSFLSGNHATGLGGAVRQSGGALIIRGSVLAGNEADGGGGAVNAFAGAPVEISLSTLNGNSSAAGDGGALRLLAGSALAISSSTIEGNDARNGGGIATLSTGSIEGSTFDLNRALGTCGGGDGDGGAMFVASASLVPLSVTNSTISDNSAGCRGGGIRLFANAAPTSLLNATLSTNSSVTGGGAIDNDAGFSGASAVFLRASLVVGGSPAGCAGDGPRASGGFNIESGATCGLGAAGDLTGTDPQIAPLRFNGGPTRTQMPSSVSPALNAVKTGCPPPATDQRGIPRPVATTCDAGAVEVSPAPLCISHPATITGTTGNDVITGTAGPDVIAGLGGDDAIVGLGGNDIVCAGVGNDRVTGGAGNDRLRGEPGDDALFGNGGRDRLEGGLGNDFLKGGRGKDKLDGGPGKNKKKQ